MNKILESALQYRKMGLSVIPVGRNKRPFIKWERYQSEKADIEQIHEWFKKEPPPNIGIVTGKISGLTVIDADSDNAFNLLNAYLPETFSTPTAKTPKGKHLYFSFTPKFSNAVRLISDIDIRNNGGYVVAPPSKNGDGNQYAWLEGIGLHEIVPQQMPQTLLDILLESPTLYSNKIDSYSSSIVPNNRQHLATHSNFGNIFTEGRRDDDLFRIANYLIRGGMPHEEVGNYLIHLAKTCTPPFPEKEAIAKVESAIKRAANRSRISTESIKEWIIATSGTFSVTNCYMEQQLQHPKDRAHVRAIFSRLVNQGIIEKIGSRDGLYRKIEDNSRRIDLSKIEEREFPIHLPFDLHELIIPQPKNIFIVAGERDSGKSCFCLNAAKINLNRGFDVKYLTSEMGGAELKSRLIKFEPEMPFRDWFKCDFCECSSNFQDAILPNGFTIIDYLKLEDNFYLIGGEIKRIFDKLDNGIVLIAIQKKHKERLGVGGQFTLDEARLYVTLSSDPPHGGLARIEKAKNWRRENVNPNFREVNFTIFKGAVIQKVGDWVRT